MKFDIPPTLPVPLSLHEGGTVRVGGTRVTLDSVMGEYLDGAIPETIADNFPTLDIGDI